MLGDSSVRVRFFKEEPVLTPEIKSEMDAAAAIAEAAVVRALFELAMAQRAKGIDDLIARVAQTVGHA